jgi:hypothetical protein
MKSLLLSIAAVALVATSTSNAAVLVYGGGTETTFRFNPGAGAITYMNCFTAIDGTGLHQLVIDSATVGIRRLVASGALTDVGINIYAAEMTFDGTSYGRGANYQIYSSPSLGGGTANVTQLVTTGAVSGVTLNLETVSSPGNGGWWMGVELTGANAANTGNGWRVVNSPTTGSSLNAFGMFNYEASGAFQAFYNLGAAPTPSRFMVGVNGTLSVSSVPEPGKVAFLTLGLMPSTVFRRRRAV